MLLIHCHLQQEIVEAFDYAVRKYYDETPMEDRNNIGVTTAMKAVAKAMHHSFKGQFFKYLLISTPKFSNKFLEVIGFPLMTPLQDFLIQ